MSICPRVFELVKTTANIADLRPVFESCTILVLRCTKIQNRLTFKRLAVTRHLFILGTQYTYMLCMDLRTNSH
jgi:hypothetical protein